MSVSALNRDADIVHRAGKVFVAGEYAWSERACCRPGRTGDALDDFLSALQAGTASGGLFWSLFGHRDDFGYVEHGDGFALYYPGFDSPFPGALDMRSRAQALRRHAHAMSGLAVPAHGIPKAPLITRIRQNAIFWRGTANADRYTVERSTIGPLGPWTIVCSQCATDNDTPWIDSTRPAGTIWYRVKGHNLSGSEGEYSPVYEASVPR
jgi:mannan endo-1,4-beta-mannosidase